jgi:phage-related holin
MLGTWDIAITVLLMFMVLDYALGLIKGKVHKRLKKWVYWFSEGECNIYSINSGAVCLIAYIISTLFCIKFH